MEKRFINSDMAEAVFSGSDYTNPATLETLTEEAMAINALWKKEGSSFFHEEELRLAVLLIWENGEVCS